jgi:hypothetical protein
VNYKQDCHKGVYPITNREKYIGAAYPEFKSNWEKRIFYMLDTNPFVLKWGYEFVRINYVHPVTGKFAIYLPDIFCQAKTESGRVMNYLIEIKPAKMKEAPKEPKQPKSFEASSGPKYQKSIARYNSEMVDYAINRAKWDAAERWCLTNQVTWIILTENEAKALFRS